MIAAIKCPHVFMNGYKNRKFNQEDLNAADIVSSLMSSAFDRIHMIETIKSRGSFFQMIINSTDVGIVYTLVNSVTAFFDSLEHVTIDTGPV
jgi:hypothetical protein